MGNNHKIYQARIWNKCFLADDKEVGGDAGMGDQAVDIEAGGDSSGEDRGEDRRTCQYVRGGHCLLHGGGAIQKFRGGFKMTIGRGRIPVKRYQRNYYYVSDLARGGGEEN